MSPRALWITGRGLGLLGLGGVSVVSFRVRFDGPNMKLHKRFFNRKESFKINGLQVFQRFSFLNVFVIAPYARANLYLRGGKPDRISQDRGYTLAN